MPEILIRIKQLRLKIMNNKLNKTYRDILNFLWKKPGNGAVRKWQNVQGTRGAGVIPALQNHKAGCQ